ncbi:MAG: glutathione S-transferase family protein [Alphaproteobacteria bacterium]
MKLYYSPSSPYVRMVHAVAILKGLDDKVEKMPARDPGMDLDKRNPLNKVPTLLTDEGETLIESKLICQYLDEIGQGPALYGHDSTMRRRVLQQEALGHGVLDAAVLCRMEERMRKPEMRSAEWLERQTKKLDAGFAAIEEIVGRLGPSVGIPHITYVCALFFIEQHKIFPGWREKFPKLAAWYDKTRQDKTLAATEPKPA